MRALRVIALVFAIIALLMLIWILLPLAAIAGPCFTVTAQPVRAIDGDTVVLAAQVWLGTEGYTVVPEKVRLLGVDTPERKEATMAAWAQARAYTSAWLLKGPVTLEACQRDAFGRVLGRVSRDGEDLAVLLVAEGLGALRTNR